VIELEHAYWTFLRSESSSSKTVLHVWERMLTCKFKGEGLYPTNTNNTCAKEGVKECGVEHKEFNFKFSRR